MLTQRYAANQRSRTYELDTWIRQTLNRLPWGTRSLLCCGLSRRAGPIDSISAHELSFTRSGILFMVAPAGGPTLHHILVGKAIKVSPMTERLPSHEVFRLDKICPPRDEVTRGAKHATRHEDVLHEKPGLPVMVFVRMSRNCID